VLVKETDDLAMSLLTGQNSCDAFALSCESFIHGSVLHKAAGVSLDEYRDYLLVDTAVVKQEARNRGIYRRMRESVH